MTRNLIIIVLLTSLCSCEQKDSAVPINQNAIEGPNNGTTGTTAVPEVELLPFEPPTPKMRRLSMVEYRNSIHDLFGDFVNISELEPDTPVNGFSSIGNAQISTSRLGVERYETAALSVAAQVLRNPARLNLMDCAPQDFIDGPCATSFVEKTGRRVFRRPLTDQEVQRYSAVAMLAMRDLGDFWLGLEFGLAALLQSPHFLYRTEWGATKDGEPWRLLTGHEIAARLSYFIWASTPDELLLTAAEEGRLDTPDGIREEVDRMLRNPRAGRGLRTLWDEFLQLGGLAARVKDPGLYPQFDAQLAADMREETLRVLERYMAGDQDFREVFSTRTTFVNSALADLYDLDESPGDDWIEVELPADGLRRGILGHASFLAGHAHAATTSPTHRGLFVRQSLLCLPIPPPPPNTDTTIDETSTLGETLRDKLAVHMENPGCAGCHTLMDPIGFGFEHFDALGQYRTQDNGVDVDASGELDGAPFSNAAELADLVATHPQLSACMVRKLYRHALGHVEGEQEQILMKELEDQWATDGYRFRDLLFALVTSDGFRYVQGGE